MTTEQHEDSFTYLNVDGLKLFDMQPTLLHTATLISLHSDLVLQITQTSTSNNLLVTS